MYLEIILKELNDSGLDYCIQNGYESMPNTFPTDVDIFYRNADEKKLDSIVKSAADKAGLLILQKVAMGYYHFAYWLSPALPSPGFQLELDFQSELSLKSMPHYYIPNRFLDRKRIYNGFYVPSPTDEIIYTIMRRTVKNNFTEKHLETIIKAYNTNPTNVEICLRQELPENVVKIILEIIETNSISIFQKYHHALYEYVCSQSKTNNTLFKRISQWKYNITRMLPLRFLHPTGMDIALLAPDGGGKSTILEALKEYGVSSFSGVERKYIRPGMFKNMGQYKPNATPEITDNPNPHGRKPDGKIKSWIRFLFYLIDFTLGYYIKIVPLKWKSKLIVFDRYYYDYYVDMYRYHYSLSKKVPHFFSFLIPTPSITFVLYAPSDVIYERKKELTLEETERQCNAFKKVAETVKGAVLIDVNRPIKDIVDDIISIMIKKKAECSLKKLL